MSRIIDAAVRWESPLKWSPRGARSIWFDHSLAPFGVVLLLAEDTSSCAIYAFIDLPLW